MAVVSLRLPSLLASALGGTRELELQAATLQDAFARIKSEHPAVARHLFDESGALRRHVLCFLNDTNARSSPADVPLRDGDTLTVMQSVSGGTGVPSMHGDLVMGYLRRWRRDPLGVLDDAGRLNASAVWFRLGPRWMLLVLHPRHVQHVLVDNQRNYEKKTKGYRKLQIILGDGLLTSGGSFWLRQRRIAQPAFHRDRLQGFVDVFQRATAEMTTGWSAREGPLDVAREMMRVTLRVVGETLLSTDTSRDADAVGPALTTVLGHTRRLITSMDPLSNAWPTAENRRFRDALATLDRIVLGVIAARRKEGAAGPQDLLAMLMAARDEESGESMTDRQLRDEVMTIFLAGHETTANALAWTLHLLGQHPDVEERLRREVGELLGDRPVRADDLPRLPYAEMVVKESMRIYPPVWIMGRTAVAEDTIEGEVVPPGTFVFLSPYLTHRHPDFWERPDDFDPERFAPERAKQIPKGLYFPFGGGPRVCIGQSFAMMEAVAILVTILQGARLRPVPGHPVTPEPLITLRPRNGILMNATPA